MKSILIVFMVLAVLPVFAQGGKLSEERRKEFDAQKVAFFTQELDLSPAEAAKFWPLYNEMQKKTHILEGEIRKGVFEERGKKNISEKQYAEAVGKILDVEKKIQSVKEEYYLKMMSVVPASKIWKLGEAERKFHRQLFDRLKKGPRPAQK